LRQKGLLDKIEKLQGAYGRPPEKAGHPHRPWPPFSFVGLQVGAAMEMELESQEPSRVSPEAIAECLINSLQINPEAHPQFPKLLIKIERIFKIYFSLEEGEIGKTSFEKLDNAIIALERVAPHYVMLYDLNKEEYLALQRKLLESGEFQPAPDPKKVKKREKKIDSLLSDLENLRKKHRRWSQDIIPDLGLAYKERENWLSWALCDLIRSFPGPRLLDKQIRPAVHSLLELQGIEEKESANPANKIRMREERFMEKRAEFNSPLLASLLLLEPPR
jgi:hypothetical protein